MTETASTLSRPRDTPMATVAAPVKYSGV
jgi:hypothetical protein